MTHGCKDGAAAYVMRPVVDDGGAGARVGGGTGHWKHVERLQQPRVVALAQLAFPVLRMPLSNGLLTTVMAQHPGVAVNVLVRQNISPHNNV